MKEQRKSTWKPWHQVVKLSEELKTGDLSLSQFAADLYDVVMDEGTDLYRDPKKFFAFTYPTYNMRELAKDVALRLAGQNDKTVRQLELTYGGGKTHTLITLYHLFNNPDDLPDIPSVRDFRSHIGIKLPRARMAVLVFDKIDLLVGVNTKGPDGKTRMLKHPWSILAYQLGGEAGLRILNGSSSLEEREEYPAEPLLKEILALPSKDDMATLVLLDEVLMYARVKVAQDLAWKDNLINFFQCLTQAATKIPNCALIASLLASDPKKNDHLGKELLHDLGNIFRRQKEEGVQPVSRDDVAEILRRRFFEPSSIMDPATFKPQVVEALKGIVELDEQTKKEGEVAEKRYLDNYPFHPDLTDVFYTKWTSLDGFQKTRGILRTFALALRDASKWDNSPIVGVSVFLAEPEKQGLSEAARELTGVAASDDFEGPRQEWAKIIEGELEKAKGIQADQPGIKHREVEQAVFTTFLHSQPIGRKARTHDLMVMLGSSKPDKIDLQKSLLAWIQNSWFLDEENVAGGKNELPENWRLGTRPNLKHMHDDALARISVDLVESKLVDEIAKRVRLLSASIPSGLKVYSMPERPSDVADNGELQIVILGPYALSEVGRPSKEATRFINETTSEDRPRVNRNAIIILTPAKDLLQNARDNIKDYLAWDDVRTHFKANSEDKDSRLSSVSVYLDSAKKTVPESIARAYCIIVTVSEKNEVIAFKVDVGTDLLAAIKAEKKARIMSQAITSSALLPDGPYDIWKEGDRSRRVSDIVGMFAQFPHLPKMLRRKEVLDTIVQGELQGEFVLRLTRPDRSIRTFWKETPGEADLKEPSLELVLPQFAELTSIRSSILTKDELPGMWLKEEISLKDVKDLFDGTRTINVPRTGFEDTMLIPRAPPVVVESAVKEAVETGHIWILSGPATLLEQEVPLGLLSDDARLRQPPEPIKTLDIVPPNLQEAWKDGQASAYSIGLFLSKKYRINLPWKTVKEAIEGAARVRLIEVLPGSASWPCDEGMSKSVQFKIVESSTVAPPTHGLRGGADLSIGDVQNLSEAVADIIGKYPDIELKVHIQLEVPKMKNKDDLMKINELLRKVNTELELK
ncbi:MAG: hypothetical protein LLG16_06880 [Euryarchaeota archaeon]|nr:hypothetical protein [Euryarchaeota archaeon]